jgi:hypothetical protein
VLRDGRPITLTAQLCDQQELARQAFEEHTGAAAPADAPAPVVQGFVESYAERRLSRRRRALSAACCTWNPTRV